MKKINKNLGFTLIELMVTVAVLAVLAASAMPSFARWIQDSRTRTIADSLQNGIRLAQTEAVRRGAQVAFYITDAEPSDSAVAATTGSNWGIRLISDNEHIQGAVLTGEGGNVVVTASSAQIVFNSIGRLTSGAGTPETYNITNSTGSRRLRVVVSSFGGVRMCDPDKSSTAPDGCRP